MENLTPEEAGASFTALAIAKRVLSQPAMQSVRHAMREDDNLSVFCGFLAREVIGEILHDFDPDLFPATHFQQTPGERGKQDGMIAKFGMSRRDRGKRQHGNDVRPEVSIYGGYLK